MARVLPILESRVDWLTATARTGERATELLDVGASLLFEERERGNYGRPSDFQGYHGTATKHAFVGYRLDGAIVRLGGELARDSWKRVHGPSQNVSRMDVAVTVQGEPHAPSLAVAYWDDLGRREETVGRPTEHTLIQTRRGGDTLYIGKRASERYGRIYDKGAQAPAEYPRGAWRFEIEYKGGTADRLASNLSTASDLPTAVAGLVQDRFQAWGIEVPWTAPPKGFTDGGHRASTDNESRMRWLREQVSVSVEKLSTSYTAQELRDALGLGDLRNPGSVREFLAARDQKK